MPITIRDKAFDRRLAKHAKRLGGISKSAAVVLVCTQWMDAREDEQRKRLHRPRPSESQQIPAPAA